VKRGDGNILALWKCLARNPSRPLFFKGRRASEDSMENSFHFFALWRRGPVKGVKFSERKVPLFFRGRGKTGGRWIYRKFGVRSPSRTSKMAKKYIAL
jgi:hypothetical protein